ncbi:hypothetical protein ACFV6F_26370, partial [Kitasatospora phosalacinea]
RGRAPARGPAARGRARARAPPGGGGRGGGPPPPAALRRLVPDLARHEVYLCGPEEFAADALRALRAAGVRAGRIHHESFAL